jgi:hypothetical protein
MENACRADNEAREKGLPATHKLKLLPQVTALLNRTSIQDAVLDPDTNFIQSVKFFLEPLSDGSLPAYSIQRDLFNALTKLPINKDVLLSSGIGKLVYFYTLSKQPEPSIKRLAERLIGEWSRPILKRTDDYRKRQIETREIDIVCVNPASMSSTAFRNPLLTYILISTVLRRWPNARRQPPSRAGRRLRSRNGLPAARRASNWSGSVPLLQKTRGPTVPSLLASPPPIPSRRRARSIQTVLPPISVPLAPQGSRPSAR